RRALHAALHPHADDPRAGGQGVAGWANFLFATSSPFHAKPLPEVFSLVASGEQIDPTRSLVDPRARPGQLCLWCQVRTGLLSLIAALSVTSRRLAIAMRTSLAGFPFSRMALGIAWKGPERQAARAAM